ncbi:hypothetical protein DEO72_LG9g373 [Vigna unguiculata]|uniref:Uncharacterized protein n=1 Tax=Vigna unguiculata TaxID=3917 RepID=A0A4D6MV64_VIGUN|nr:hypothetical protein DEO72_LG9g373 [Vigna unguiculata]
MRTKNAQEKFGILILPRLICLGWPGTETYNDAVTFLQLEPNFRPRFSKYPKPNRGIGPGSLKTGAKEGYRPRSSRTRSQKVAGSQGVRNSRTLLPPRASDSAIPLYLCLALSLARSLSLAHSLSATTPSDHRRRVSAAAPPATTTPEHARGSGGSGGSGGFDGPASAAPPRARTAPSQAASRAAI